MHVQTAKMLYSGIGGRPSQTARTLLIFLIRTLYYPLPIHMSVLNSVCTVILIGICVKIGLCIDPEYSWDNRINSFLTASLNSFLSVTKADEKPLKEDVTFWCVNR